MTSLRNRLIVTLGVAQSLLLVGAAAGAWWLVSGTLRSSFDHSVLEKARALATLVVQDGQMVELEFGDGVMPAYGDMDAPDYFQIWIGREFILERSVSLTRSPTKNLELRAGPADAPKHWSGPLPDGRPGRFAGIELPIHEYSEVSEDGETSAPRQNTVVVVGTESAPLDGALVRAASGLCALALLWILASTGAVFLAVRRGLRPVSDLARRLSDIRDPAQREDFAAEPVPAELSPIVSSTSDMLARIEELLERERRFSGNVAHELRTPVSELRTAADVALLDAEDHEGLRRAAIESRDIAIEMERTIATLLTLWRRGDDAAQSSPVTLSSLIEAQFALHRGTVDARGLTVSRGGNGDAPVQVPAGAAQLVLGNLVRNAVEHSRSDSAVTWSTVSSPDGLHCDVENVQDHLDPAFAAQITDPFWSDPASRGKSEHSGLGLSLAKAICETEGWSLALDVTSDRFRARVTIPNETRASS